jgi:exopolysaccharide biosynthesis polyprenyl glycosylphosphotransferase
VRERRADADVDGQTGRRDGGPKATTEVGARRRVVSTEWGRRDAVTRRLLAAADVIGLVVAVSFAGLAADQRPDWLELVAAFVPTLPAWTFLFKLYGLYDRDIKRISHTSLDDLPWLFHALVVGTLLLWAYYKLIPVPQLTFLETALFGIAAVIVISLLRSIVRTIVPRILGPERVLIAGTGSMTIQLIRKMSQHPEYGLNPIGLIAQSPNGTEEAGLPMLGDPADFDRVAREVLPNRVVICRKDFTGEEVLDLIERCRALSVKVSILPAMVDSLGPSVEIDEVEGVTVLGVNPPVLGRTSRLIKRGFDCVVAVPLLVALLPLIAAIATAIKMDTRGPVLFRQPRIGKGGRRFLLLKFRTMVADAERRKADLLSQSSDPNWLHLERDPRVTRVGRLLRLTSLDELPQLWNVVRGEMSLVGPRPLIEEEDRRIGGWARGRLDLTPGITGLWQVLGRTSIPFEEMVKLDYLYVTNWSLWLDIRLLLRTLPAVMHRRGAN